MNYQTTKEIEIVLAYHFNYRQNLIVPCVSWGFDIHECDILIMSKAGYLTEIEIKISTADLKKDAYKQHGHKSNKVRRLYFAIPSKLCKNIEHIPLRAGILVVTSTGSVVEIARPEINKLAKPVPDNKKYELARLGALRIWNLKSEIQNLKNRIRTLNDLLQMQKPD